jgi:hypothetical protein
MRACVRVLCVCARVCARVCLFVCLCARSACVCVCVFVCSHHIKIHKGVDVFVGGRTDSTTGRFVTMSDFLACARTPPLPRRVLRMFKEISESDFRADVSSTDLRLSKQQEVRLPLPGSTGTAAAAATTSPR